jgi:hypothetical protein
MKTVLNNSCSHIGYEHDGRLVHTDKKTGAQMVSIYTWPSLRGAREALANAFGKIQWQKFDEPRSGPFRTAPFGKQ